MLGKVFHRKMTWSSAEHLYTVTVPYHKPWDTSCRWQPPREMCWRCICSILHLGGWLHEGRWPRLVTHCGQSSHGRHSPWLSFGHSSHCRLLCCLQSHLSPSARSPGSHLLSWLTGMKKWRFLLPGLTGPFCSPAQRLGGKADTTLSISHTLLQPNPSRAPCSPSPSFPSRATLEDFSIHPGKNWKRSLKELPRVSLHLLPLTHQASCQPDTCAAESTN